MRLLLSGMSLISFLGVGNDDSVRVAELIDEKISAELPKTGIKPLLLGFKMLTMGTKNNIQSAKSRNEEAAELKRLQRFLKRAVQKERAPDALRLRIQKMIRES